MKVQPTVVAHPVTGLIITPSVNNPEYGKIRLDQEVRVFNNGFMSIQKRTAFVAAKIEDLESLKLRVGSIMEGKIIKIESFSPQYEGHTPKINPTTGEVVLTNGRETYLTFKYVENPKAMDTWIEEEEEVLEEIEQQSV